MSAPRLATSLLLAVTLSVPSLVLAESTGGSADEITHRQENFDLERQNLQNQLQMSEMNAKNAEANARIAEAKARIAEAQRKQKPSKDDASGADGDADPLAKIDPKELRQKLGLPPTGPIVQKDDSAKDKDEAKQQMPPADPSEYALPRLVSTSDSQATFMVANRRTQARAGEQINQRYRLKSIDGDGVIIKSASGQTRRLTIDWSTAGIHVDNMSGKTSIDAASQPPGMSTIR